LLIIELEDDTVTQKDTVFLLVVVVVVVVAVVVERRRMQVLFGRMASFHTYSYFGRHDEML
jgi:hypothetical protein